MINNWIDRRILASLVWIVALLGADGLWFWLTSGNDVQGLLGAAALILTAILGTVGLSRARAARRFNAAMDTYAEREIGREWWRKKPPRVRGVSTLGGALSSGSTHGRERPAEARNRFTRRLPPSSQR